MAFSNEVIVQMKFEPTNVKREFVKVEQQAAKTGKSAATGFAKGFSSKIKSSMQGVRGEIVKTAAAFFAFSKSKDILVGSVGAAADFQKSLVEINTILPKNTKLTNEQTKALRALGVQYGTGATAQAKSYYQIISSGVTDAVKANKLLVNANKLAVGGLSDAGSSINILTSILNGYGQENITAGEAADSLFTAVRLGKTTVSELASNLASAIPAARNAGISLDLVNASVATLTANGDSTSAAVTKVNAVISALARNGEKLGKGMDLAAVKADGLIPVLQRLQARTGGNSDELFKLLGRQEAVLGVQTLARNNAKDLSDTYAQFTEKLGAASKAFKQVEESASFKFDKAKAQINDLAISLGSKLLPIVVRTLSGLDRLFNAFGDKKEASALDTINQAISKQRTELNKNIDILKGFKDSQDDFFGGASDEMIRKKTEEIKNQRTAIKGLIAERTALSESRRDTAANDAEMESLRSAQGEYEKYQEQQRLIAEEKAIRDQLALDAEAKKREDLLLTQTAQQLFAENTNATFAGLVDRFGLAGKRAAKIGAEISAAIFNTLSSGVGRAFQSVGKALANGENAFSAFADALKGVLGEVASAIGDTFIKWGLANLVTPGMQGVGIAQIAAGGALKVLSGALGASGGSGGDTSGATAGGGTSTVSVDDSGINDLQETATPAEERVNLSLNVEGNVIRDSEVQNWVSDLLETGSSRDATVIPSLTTGL